MTKMTIAIQCLKLFYVSQRKKYWYTCLGEKKVLALNVYIKVRFCYNLPSIDMDNELTRIMN